MAPFDGPDAMPLVIQAASDPQAECWARHDLLPALWRVVASVMAAKIGRRFRPAVEVAVAGICPPHDRSATLRVVDELVTNAVEHAFGGRERGRIVVTIDSRPAMSVLITVSDTGYGFRQDDLVEGNGLRLLRMLGEVSVRSGQDHCTVQCRLRVGAVCSSGMNTCQQAASV